MSHAGNEPQHIPLQVPSEHVDAVIVNMMDAADVMQAGLLQTDAMVNMEVNVQ